MSRAILLAAIIIVIIIFMLIYVFYNSINSKDFNDIDEPMSGSAIYDNLTHLNDLVSESADEIETNLQKVKELDDDFAAEYISEINEKIKLLNDSQVTNKIVIDENQLKIDKLKELNKSLDILIVSKQEKEHELRTVNTNMSSIIEHNTRQINQLMTLNEKMTDIIETSNHKIDRFMKKKHDATLFCDITTEINNAISSGLINNGKSGDSIINGMNKIIHMDESTIFVKVDSTNNENYYSPVYKVDDRP